MYLIEEFELLSLIEKVERISDYIEKLEIKKQNKIFTILETPNG